MCKYVCPDCGNAEKFYRVDTAEYELFVTLDAEGNEVAGEDQAGEYLETLSVGTEILCSDCEEPIGDSRDHGS